MAVATGAVVSCCAAVVGTSCCAAVVGTFWFTAVNFDGSAVVTAAVVGGSVVAVAVTAAVTGGTVAVSVVVVAGG